MSRPVILRALGNTRLARLVGAYAGSTISEWSTWLAVLVYAEKRSGTTAAGWAAMLLLVPAMVTAPFVGRAADGRRPIRSLMFVYAAQGLAAAVAAVMAQRDASVIAVAFPTAVAIAGVTYVRPSFAVISGGIVRSARELTAANLFAGYCDSGAILLGPVIATALLTLGGPALVLASCSLFGFGGVLATATLLRHDRPKADTNHAEDHDLGGSRGRQVFHAVRTRPNLRALLSVLGTQHVIMGFIGPMFVILAIDELHRSSSSAGALNVAFGVGAVASTVFATWLAGRGRVSPIATGALAMLAASLLAIGVAPRWAVALVALTAAGFARSLVDVTARMLLQRSAPPDLVGAVFAFIEVLTFGGLAVGTALAQITAATVGTPRGFVIAGMIPAVVVVLTATQVWRADHQADVPVVAIGVLRRTPVFRAASATVLEQVARAAVERHVDAGTELMRQGDVGDRYVAMSSGTADVVRDGAVVAVLTRGDGAGEVALLADAPRNATVVTTTASIVYEVPRAAFLWAVTGHDATRDAAWRQVERLR